MLSLVEGGHLEGVEAKSVAKAIHAVNPMFISSKILSTFEKEVDKKIPKK
jgi:hypothetical protein